MEIFAKFVFTVNLQVEVMGENGEDFQNIFREGVLKLKLRFLLRKVKLKLLLKTK